jgi:hypothetical protein
MPDRGRHCPFLNRTDSRCAAHLCLEDLDYAFRYCFDRYKSCPTYLELLVERRVRRSGEPGATNVRPGVLVDSSMISNDRFESARTSAGISAKAVQVTVGGRIQRPAAAALPAVSGL